MVVYADCSKAIAGVIQTNGLLMVARSVFPKFIEKGKLMVNTCSGGMEPY